MLSSLLLGLPCPAFYLFYPYVNYISVHLFMTAILHRFPQVRPCLPSFHIGSPQVAELSFLTTVAESSLWPLDAIFRTNGIASTFTYLSLSEV